MTYRSNMLFHFANPDELMGRFSEQETAPGKRPLSERGVCSIVKNARKLEGWIYLRLAASAFTLSFMRRSAAYATVFVLLLSVSSPLLACMLPGRVMTATEHSCCKKMAQMCGAMKMPQSHTCCKKSISETAPSVAVVHHNFVPALSVLAFSAPQNPQEFSLHHFSFEHPPNDSPPGSAVLRI